MARHCPRTRTLATNHDSIRIPTKRPDILSYPLQRQSLILQTVIPRASTTAAHPQIFCSKKSKSTETVLRIDG